MKKVLVVDDAPVDSQNLQRIFADAGWMVITASSGAEAVTKAKAEVPDLIMMDVNMPGLDGFSATRQLMHQRNTGGVCHLQRSKSRPRVCADAGCQRLRHQALHA
jgi:twitching motility two-component system response regulator PilH